MPDILRTLLLLDREKWNLGYNLSNFQTLFMIFLVQVLALQHYYKCDDFLVTGNNLDEKKRLLKEASVLLMLMNTENILRPQIMNLSVSLSN